MLERQFNNNAESLRSFFKDQIVSDNTNITPLLYSVADTKPGSYDVIFNGSSTTIDGVAASASGNQYTVSSGNANGIKVEITRGATSGKIHYGRSFITQLDEEINTFIKFNGLIDNSIEGNKNRLKDLVKQQESLDDKIASLYQRYRSQYSYMEGAIAALNETGNMLENAFKSGD